MRLVSEQSSAASRLGGSLPFFEGLDPSVSPRLASASTTARTSCARSRGTTRTASSVSTMTRSLHADEGPALRASCAPRREVPHEVVRRVDRDGAGGQRVARGVLLGHLPGDLPAPDVVPAEVARDDGDALRLLHDAVVDRDRRQRREHLGQDARLVARAAAASSMRSSPAASAGRCSAMAAFMTPRAEEEHPPVPEVAPVGHEGLGALARRLLDEARDGACTPSDTGAPTSM